MEIRQAYSVEQTVYFESQTDRVLICVEFTAVVVLKYRGILSLDCIHHFLKRVIFARVLQFKSEVQGFNWLESADFCHQTGAFCMALPSDRTYGLNKRLFKYICH